MNIIADTHTHTIASGHAHSTVMENAAEAARMGHKFLVIADHAPQIPGAPTELYFRSMRESDFFKRVTFRDIYAGEGAALFMPPKNVESFDLSGMTLQNAE